MTNKYNLTEEEMDALGLNNPEIVAEYGNKTPEEIKDLKEKFKEVLYDVRRKLDSGVVHSVMAEDLDYLLRGYFAEIVAGQTEAIDWLYYTDQWGSQGIVDLPAGQDLIKEFFEGDDFRWYDLMALLLDIFLNKPLVLEVTEEIENKLNDLCAGPGDMEPLVFNDQGKVVLVLQYPDGKKYEYRSVHDMDSHKGCLYEYFVGGHEMYPLPEMSSRDIIKYYQG